MNVNIVYINDNLSSFHMDDPTNNWITNCYGENFYAVNTGSIIEDKSTLHKLPFVKIENSHHHEHCAMELAICVERWWNIVHPKFLMNLNLPTKIKKDGIVKSDWIQKWGKFCAAIDTISINNSGHSDLCVLTSKLKLIPKDLPDLATKFHKDKWEKTIGGGLYEPAPINGSREIYVDENMNIIIGHYHALYQMFKLEQMKNVLGNMHLIGSTMNRLEFNSMLEIFAFHLGLRLNEIT